MKKVVLLILICLGVLFLVNYARTLFRSTIESALSLQPDKEIQSVHPTPTSPAAKTINETLFVPYWSVSDTFSAPNYQKLVYFGVKASSDGIDTSDDGYLRLPAFSQGINTQQTLLALRMIDNTSNFSILKNKVSQEKIITQSIQLAKKYHFKGVVLDLEVTALPFSSLLDQITSLNIDFAKKAHASGLTYSVTAYGDSFYRVRPFDIKKIAELSDNVYIMAYDFDKANGNPGPSFPLAGTDKYGYDYSRMIDNFADVVPLNKLIITFGMYGYDWVVDSNDKAQKTGESISLKDINATIITTCRHESCEWERDSMSSETRAIYKDSDRSRHIVWFEDTESVTKKQDFLKKRGIGSYAYWAYSYF